jgi:hypothetical protein
VKDQYDLMEDEREEERRAEGSAEGGERGESVCVNLEHAQQVFHTLS